MSSDAHGQDSALRLESLSRSFGGVRAVNDVSFALASGRITGLIGPNGAGKSTVVDLVSGVVKPTTGRIFYRGQNIAGWSAERVARQGLLRTFQLSSEFPRLTVLENVLQASPHQRGDSVIGALLGPRYWRARESELIARARALLQRFGLAELESAYAGDLSGGQKRLVELVRALMGEPTLLLLDEPFAGLSPTASRVVQQYLLALRADNLTMLLIEHELESVDRLCDSVVVMAAGSVLARGSMAELRQNQEVIDAYLGG